MGLKIRRIEDVFPAWKKFVGYSFECYSKVKPCRRWQTYRAFVILYLAFKRKGLMLYE